MGWSIPEDYRGWVEQDIESPSFLWWQLIAFLIGAPFALALLGVLLGPDFNPWPHLLGLSIGALIGWFFSTDSRRSRALRYHEKKWARKRERDEGPDFRRLP